MLRLASTFSRLSYRSLSAAAVAPKTSKEALATLRKRTGYSYTNIRKAVDKFGPERIDEAEKWLKELAVKEGWAKAAKLGTRVASQGLLGVETSKNAAAVVELNCETDFVARSDVFKHLLEEITQAAIDAGKGLAAPADKQLASHLIEASELLTRQNRTVKEAIAMTVGKLGENITISRAQIFIAPSDIEVYARSHPREGTEATEMGRFVSVVGIHRKLNVTQFPTDKLASQLCQHVIGMQPESLGTPTQRQQSTEETQKVADGEKDELNEFYTGKTTQMNEDETQLLRQSFMLNPSQSVYDYLQSHGAEVISFARLELGVNNNAETQSS
uniref:Elongation factor Ts, mitochondrial n=1 Tax=Panagrolaimus davidi TaxID=227884 RepID=A0A914QRV8_9BILA